MKSFLTFVNEQESVKYQWGVNDFLEKEQKLMMFINLLVKY